jgi:hypothetical protein
VSRSVHATAAEFRRLVECGEPPEVLRAEAAVLRDKHRVKRAVRRQRREAERPVAAAIDLDLLPIRVHDEGPHVHHAASPDDVRQVLRRLPPGTLDGLAAVNLKLGRYEQLRRARRHPAGETPDPFTGRLGYELEQGIWCGRVLGRYRPHVSTIEVYAHVVANRGDSDWPYWRWMLRFEALATLVHEAGHHHDHACRVARGRWRAAAGLRAEAYANARAREWVLGVVAPYLEERYPEGEALRREHASRQGFRGRLDWME